MPYQFLKKPEPAKAIGFPLGGKFSVLNGRKTISAAYGPTQTSSSEKNAGPKHLRPYVWSIPVQGTVLESADLDPVANTRMPDLRQVPVKHWF